jgi:excisionase family DNA binding protein
LLDGAWLHILQPKWLKYFLKCILIGCRMTEKQSDSTGNAKRLFSIKELAAEIGGTKWFWRSMIWDAELPCVRVGKKMFVDRNDVEAFIEKNKHRN